MWRQIKSKKSSSPSPSANGPKGLIFSDSLGYISGLIRVMHQSIVLRGTLIMTSWLSPFLCKQKLSFNSLPLTSPNRYPRRGRTVNVVRRELSVVTIQLLDCVPIHPIQQKSFQYLIVMVLLRQVNVHFLMSIQSKLKIALDVMNRICKIQFPDNLELENFKYLRFYFTFRVEILSFSLKLPID